ncbi:MAG: hypothetical protein EP329_08455 [Deltaproteobacteria bacterium]|nr:MAG: hypothetical protein EP329_08455 [Deltaproteobacteria bacterium]
MSRLLRWLTASRSAVLGMNRRNCELVLPKNPRRHFDIANDKLLTKRILAPAGVPVAPTLTTFSSFFELAELDDRLAGHDSFAVKPSRGAGGRGVLVVAGRDGDRFRTPSGRWVERDALSRRIADIVYGVYTHDKPDVALVEPRLVPHPFFAGLFPSALSDVRVIVVDDVPALAMLRVPTESSDGRANLHQGGLGLGVDLATGEINRGWHRGRPITHHPDSGAPLLGMRVPQWDEVLDISRRTSRAVPLNYLGLDIVFDATLGPLVLEINVRPGLEIQNVTGVPLRGRLGELGLEATR